MTALLIDDEPAANVRLRDLLTTNHPDIHLLGEAGGVAEGLHKIEQHRPDLIFLDIEMPPSTGFELVRELPRDVRPEVVFVTSRKEHALQAFQCAALGYILKPVKTEELAQTVELVRERIHHKNSEQRLNTLLKNLDTQDDQDKRLSVTVNGEMKFLRLGTILCCRGEDRYTRIYLSDGSSVLSSYPVGQYARMLEELDDFLITHRSWLVNRRFVQGWASVSELRLTNGVLAGVSKRHKKEVKRWLAVTKVG